MLVFVQHVMCLFYPIRYDANYSECINHVELFEVGVLTFILISRVLNHFSTVFVSIFFNIDCNTLPFSVPVV